MKFQNCILINFVTDGRTHTHTHTHTHTDKAKAKKLLFFNFHQIIYSSSNTQSSRKRQIRRIFTPTFGFVRLLFLLGILIYAIFFCCRRVSNSLKTPEDDSGSPNLASATKYQKIAANLMPPKCPVVHLQ